MAKLTGIKGLEIQESTVAWEPTIWAEKFTIPTILLYYYYYYYYFGT